MVAEYVLLGEEEQIHYAIDRVISHNDVRILGYYNAVFEDILCYGVAFRTQTDIFKERMENLLDYLIQYRIIKGKGFASYSLKRVGDDYRRCDDLIESEDLVLLLDVGEVDNKMDDYAIPEEV